MLRTPPFKVRKPPVHPWNCIRMLLRMRHGFVGDRSAPFLHEFHLFYFHNHDFVLS